MVFADILLSQLEGKEKYIIFASEIFNNIDYNGY